MFGTAHVLVSGDHREGRILVTRYQKDGQGRALFVADGPRGADWLCRVPSRLGRLGTRGASPSRLPTISGDRHDVALDSTDPVGRDDPAAAAPDPVARVVDVAAAAAADYLTGIPNRRVSPDPDALAAIAGFDVELPDGPRNPADVVTLLHRLGSPATTASAGGRFFGLVVGGTLPAALGARVLASAWDQVVFNDQTSPIGCALERITAGWLTDLLGLPPSRTSAT